MIEEELATPSALIPFALFEVVYMINGGFMRRGQLLDGCTVLKDYDIKVRITHGRADYVCQPQVRMGMRAWHFHTTYAKYQWCMV